MTIQSAIFIVIGTCGVGKSTIASALATKLKGAFVEADEFHPAENIAAMSQGIALNDEMRWHWLRQLSREIRQQSEQHNLIFVACSALKKRYRDFLRNELGDIYILYLNAEPETIRMRIQSRKDHFMPLTLLESQLRDLEPPSAQENLAYDLDANGDPDNIVNEASHLIQQRLKTL